MIVPATIATVASARRAGGGGGGGSNPVFANVEYLMAMGGANGSTTFLDSSTFNHAVTRFGNAVLDTSNFPTGIGTGAMLLDGAGDYLSIPIASHNLAQGPWNIGVWFLKNGDTFEPLVHFGPNGDDLYFTLNFGRMYCGDGVNNNIIQGGNAPATGQWHYGELSFNGTTYRMYVDGVLEGTSTVLLKNTTTTVGLIGGRPGLGLYKTGRIGQVRFSNEAGPFGMPTSGFPTS